ncbi:MAG: hypothetical protein KKE44_23885 [Proteobacteria bacterium]|nr:hypothetical protein [Pseudomonadota bacterium]MBU1585774.1 hypothetical protein [Pseudomonadota bacterium]MBU2630242.1 hypothetical protein [Pseudomonadota bacterium]
MGQENQETLTVQKLAQDLSAFAFDRTDLKELLAAIPKDSQLNLTTIEYELQLLKILSVGWGIAFFMPATNKNKGPVTQMFWESIRQISNSISTLTQTTTGQQIDYFEILKDRLNTYLAIMQENPDEARNPADFIGPAFAGSCHCENDAIAILTGTKMFTLTLGAVKEYLNSVKIDDIKLN